MPIPKGTRAARIKANVTHRQALKKKWDRHCKYSADDASDLDGVKNLSLEVTGASPVNLNAEDKGENWTRLLDEGVVVDGDGYAWAVIRKGVIKKFYESLPDNYKGHIDKDHIRSIYLGSYGKKDLRLVDLGNDRYALDVNVKLDDELYAVKDLKREHIHKALSVEIFTNVDEFATAEKVTGDPKQGKWLVPLIDDLFVEGYAVCENPKNANSYKDDLLDASASEGNSMNKEELKKLAAEGDAEAKAKLEALEAEEADAADDTGTDDGDATEGDGADATEGDDLSAAGDGDTEGEATDDATDAGDEEGSDDGEKADEETDNASIEEKVEKLEKAFKELSQENSDLKKKNAELEAKLSAKDDAEKDLAGRIDDLLGVNFSAADETEGEKAKETPDTDKKDGGEDELMADLAASFKELN